MRYRRHDIRAAFVTHVAITSGSVAAQPRARHAMLRARDSLRKEVAALHRQLLTIARGDDVCRHMMTVPGVGALTALTFKTVVDDPTRVTSSKRLGAPA